jgi:hypothetical protein
VPFVIYALDDCTIRVHNPDGMSVVVSVDTKNSAFAENSKPLQTRSASAR